MKHKRYGGVFLSRANVRWRVEIWQESAVAYAAEELSFPGESPLVVEWQRVNKTEPVQSSNATLKIFSPTDRKYTDLYTTTPGEIRLDVYRDDALYWSGTMDTEVYEEPYSERDGYVVTLTFSDFAILDRIKFETTNRQQFTSLAALIEKCIAGTQINLGAQEEHVSTTVAGGALLTTAHAIDANFFDEDDEPMTLRDVLDGILQPFALRIIQKAGRMVLYDINALGAATETVWWAATDSVLSMDETFNNVEIAFSPYMNFKLIESELEPAQVGSGATHLIRTEYSAAAFDGFEIRLSDQTIRNREFEKVKPNARFFAINPIYSGDGVAGVAAVVKTLNSDGSYTAQTGSAIWTPTADNVLFRCKRKPYIYVTPESRNNYLINLKVEALVSSRYNPFEDAHRYNEEGDESRFQNQCNYGYIPFRLVIRNAQGVAMYHYSNDYLLADIIAFPSMMAPWLQINWQRVWPAGAGGWGDNAYLAYYQSEKSSRKNKSGFDGWATNKPMLGYFDRDLPNIYKKMSEGEYIPLPPVSGWLDIEISSAILLYDYQYHRNFDYNKVRWQLIKNVSVTLLDRYGNEIDEEDAVTRAWVTDTAKEDLELETVVGTLPDGAHPTARGQLFRADGSVIEQFTRAGVTDKMERLLAGTVYSQYFGRKKKLSGTARIIFDFAVITDMHEAQRFIATAETQDVIEDESDIELTEIAEDNYTGIRFTELTE